ncbi:ATP-binding protein [Roseateles sp.]|uniref:ATP-binding protein n=1 Tax=Roseateles sp. TaxID=1971397 RepID=UPI002E06BA5E|nr:ATP-binding protein [Roseateles sp.]
MIFDVAHQEATARQRRTVALLCLGVGLSVLLALPVASRRLESMPHIAGIYGASAAMIDLATFWLLLSSQRPSRPLRVVAAAYLYAGLMAVLHVLTFPGALLQEESILGNGNVASWLFIAWRTGFPAFILWAVCCEIRVPGSAAAGAARREAPPALMAVGVAAVSLLAALAAAEVPSLVPGPLGPQFSLLSSAGAYAGAVVSGVTLALIYRHGLTWRALYVWLMLVLVSETAGIWLSTYSGGRYTVAWYGARAEGLLASAIVLVLLASHIRELQSRLSTAVVELSERTDALQAEIQHRERAERMLVQSQKLEAVGQLAAGLAHDINNFMQVVGIRAELMRRRVGDVVEADVAVIQRNVRKAENLTRQLLLFSGRRQLQSRTVWLQRSLPAFLEGFKPVLGDRLEVRLDLPAAAWPVFVDPTELDIALANLLTNARDATPPGGRVTVRVANQAAEGVRGEQVCVEIQDEGQGIPAATLERVFEPFFTTKEPGKGSGLGLSQVYAFVRGSGGEIVIDSLVGHGTTVRMSFPRHAGATESGPDEPSAATAPSPGSVVLLVDDNPDVLEATSALLQQAGLAVRTAASAAQALALLDGGLRPDMLVSDIVMPGGMDGLGLAQQTRQRLPSLRIVLATGYSSAAADARAQGFTVLRKPYESARLLTALQEPAGGVTAA